MMWKIRNLAVGILFICGLPLSAQAQVSYVVDSIEGTIIQAMGNFIGVYTAYLMPTILAIFTLSVLLYGIKMIYAVQGLQKLTIIFVLKLAIVAGFTFNMGYFSGVPFQIVHGLIYAIVGGVNPWAQMDAYIAALMGNGNLANGIVGVLGAALFSGIQGLLVFLLGFIGVFSVLYLGFRAAFTYLSSIVLIAFIMLISPLILPFAMFTYTERIYFKKWLDLLIAAMINPVIVIAFLWMILGMVGTAVTNILGIPNLQGGYRMNKNMFSWLMPNDPNRWVQLEQTLGQTTQAPTVQSFMSPTLFSSMDANVVSTAALDFGPDQVWTMQELTFHFLGLFIVSYLLLSLLNSIPSLADGIAGVATGMEWQGMPFVKEIKQAIGTIKAAAGGGG
jgi:hypothetical protein